MSHTDDAVWLFSIQGRNVMEMDVAVSAGSYRITLEHGLLAKVSDYVPQGKRVFVISDDGVPAKWRDILQAQFPDQPLYVIPHGEDSKCFDQLQKVLAAMLEAHLSRKDLVIALGGGVVGDLSGFAAAIYMRGIEWINVPTTMLAMVDSSIGGKTAIDFNSVKNSVGAFWQPKAVLIDPDVLSTLSPRLLSEGCAEAIKTGLIRDPELFEIFEQDDWQTHLDTIIERSLAVKKAVVEADERESGERKLLNFGHTFGHAYESLSDGVLLHGEAVSIGMMTILENEEIKRRLKKVLDRLNLPCEYEADPSAVYERIRNDKKASHDSISIVQVPEIGKGTIETWTMAQVKEKLGI